MYISQPVATLAVIQAGGKIDGQQLPTALGTSCSTFSTTQTFTTTHGFVISEPATGVHDCTPSNRHGSSSGSSIIGSDRSSTPRVTEQSSTPVGWSGLLEISRATGGQGVVGSVPAAGEHDCEDEQGHIEVCCTAHTTTGVRRLVKSVIRGLKARQEPEKAREGMGGTYFFPNELGKKCAIFKPCDEEPLAPANPKGFIGRNLGDPGWKSTVRVGEAAMREVAAYLLDYDHFAQVPHTVLVQAQHPLFNYIYAPANGAANAGGSNSLRSASMSSVASEQSSVQPPAAVSGGSSSSLNSSSSGRPLKLGSLQEFVYHIADTNEMGSSRFRTRDVYAIGILDIRLFNTDRHAGNILVREPIISSRDPSFSSSRPSMFRSTTNLNAAAAAAVLPVGSHELIPIDHGFCLPEALEAPYFEWLHWPQACLPFDEVELAYIARLDPAADVALLQRELPNLRPECLRVLEVATTFLKRCAAAGLTLADIGALASRPLDALDDDDSCPSALEKACIAARQAVETRELTAMLSSSFSSSDGAFALKEEDEDGFVDSDSELEDESVQSAGVVPADADLSSDAECNVAYEPQQPQRRPRSPSRLGAMCSAASDELYCGDATVAADPAVQAVAAKVSGGDLATSVRSEGTVFALATAMSLGSKGGPGEADLLFDLEEDASSSAAATPDNSSGRLLAGKQHDEVMAGASPPPFGNSSVASMDAEQLTTYLGGSQLLSSTRADGPGLSVRTAGLSPLPAAGMVSPITPAVARSVHMGEGWMFRGLKTKAAAALIQRTVNGNKKVGGAGRRRTCLQRAIYPPPVVRAAPRSTNEVLSGLSEEQWAAFMAELQLYMDEALRPAAGSWRRASEAAGFGGAALSCPRF